MQSNAKQCKAMQSNAKAMQRQCKAIQSPGMPPRMPPRNPSSGEGSGEGSEDGSKKRKDLLCGPEDASEEPELRGTLDARATGPITKEVRTPKAKPNWGIYFNMIPQFVSSRCSLVP